MNQPFDETYRSAAQDPLNAPDQDFDWQGLYQRLNEDAANGANDHQLSQVVIHLLQMLLPLSGRRIQPESLGMRLIALAWVLSPGYFEGTPSIRKLVRRCGVRFAALANYTGYYSRLLQWRNRGQSHAWNWRKTVRPREQSLIRPSRPSPKNPPAAVACASPPWPTTPGTTAACCIDATGAKATPGTGCGTGRR